MVFSNIKADRILYIKHSRISCHGYIEFSKNVVSLTDHIEYITVQENTLINMTNNECNISRADSYYYEGFSISNFIAPCYYQ